MSENAAAGADGVETVGLDDAEADAVRSGADTDSGLFGDVDSLVDGSADSTDTDGEPVGVADADADARRSGADTDGI